MPYFAADNDNANVNRHPEGLSYKVALLGADKPAVVATDAKPRAEISLLNLCRGAKEENCKLTDASLASAYSYSFNSHTPEAVFVFVFVFVSL